MQKFGGWLGRFPVEVVRSEWIGSDALNVVYRGADGPAEVPLFRDAEPRLELVQAARAFSFDGDGETFRIASEAQRIRLAQPICSIFGLLRMERLFSLQNL